MSAACRAAQGLGDLRGGVRKRVHLRGPAQRRAQHLRDDRLQRARVLLGHLLPGHVPSAAPRVQYLPGRSVLRRLPGEQVPTTLNSRIDSQNRT